jgi:hypothetical protein
VILALLIFAGLLATFYTLMLFFLEFIEKNNFDGKTDEIISRIAAFGQ